MCRTHDNRSLHPVWPNDLCEPLWANQHAGWCGAGGENPPATRLCEFLISFQVHTPALEQDTLGICQQERGEQGSRSDIRQRTLRRGPRRIASPKEQGLLWPADRISGASLPRIRVPAQKADIATCCPCSDPGTRGHGHMVYVYTLEGNCRSSCGHCVSSCQGLRGYPSVNFSTALPLNIAPPPITGLPLSCPWPGIASTKGFLMQIGDVGMFNLRAAANARLAGLSSLSP